VTAGTFPTFVVGNRVMKLFGEMFRGAQRFAVERTVHRLLSVHPAIPAPALIADGCLFGEGEQWPYLITSRLDAPAWSDASLGPRETQRLAHQLGTLLCRIHELPVPRGPLWDCDVVTELRAGCVERHRQWRSLPERLIKQIDRFLIAPSSVRRLIHADLHADHIFVDRAALTGIIDWGNAMAADPYYELPALHLHTFHGDTLLLEQFLHGYGWQRPSDFARRAMSMTLLHEFNVLSGVSRNIDLASVASLEDLADTLWNGAGTDTKYHPIVNETPPADDDASR
jgi:aminoglycoside phosphotransferase (APT) family kinase protein